jgi:hypothetical protein
LTVSIWKVKTNKDSVRGKFESIRSKTTFVATSTACFSPHFRITMSASAIHGYVPANIRTSTSETKRPIIGKVSSFFHRKSVASNQSAMNHSTFHPGWDDADIKARKFEELLSDYQEEQSMEDIDKAFEKLIVSRLIIQAYKTELVLIDIIAYRRNMDCLPT